MWCLPACLPASSRPHHVMHRAGMTPGFSTAVSSALASAVCRNLCLSQSSNQAPLRSSLFLYAAVPQRQAGCAHLSIRAGYAEPGAHACLPALLVVGVPGDHHHHPVPSSSQCLGERAHHITQATWTVNMQAQSALPPERLVHRRPLQTLRTAHVTLMPPGPNPRSQLSCLCRQ